MRPLDTILITILFFAGVCFLARFGFNARIGSILGIFRQRYICIHRDLTRRLIDSGLISFPGVRLADSVKSWSCAEISSLCFASIWLVCTTRTQGTTLAVLPLTLVPGFAILLLSLKSEASGIIRGFNQDLPLAAFLMSLLIESGMGASAAMQETVDALPSRACAGEIREILRGRELGIPKRELFEGSRIRVPLDDYRAFLNLIEQGERLGVGLSQGLNELSGRILESQAHRAEMLAQQAAVKMLIPLVLFIFPAVFLIVLSPVILNLCSMAGW